MTNVPHEVIFHRYFSQLPKYLRDVYRGRLDLDRFEIPELANAFSGIQDEINSRWTQHAPRILAPSGEVKLHFDYIEAPDLNAITFGHEGISFVGVTSGMLAHIARTSEAMWRLNLLSELLGVELSGEVRDFLFQAVLLFQLQFLSSHELGHLFHGHVDRQAFQEEYLSATSTMNTPSHSGGMRDQVREVEADGYAVHSILDNFVATENGRFIHGRIRSTLPQEECILTLLLLSVGFLFFFLRPRPFEVSGVRPSDHPFGLARMNIVLHDVIAWCQLNRPGLEAWASFEKFQEIMWAVSAASGNAEQLEAWLKQGEFLKSAEGKKYLGDLYAERERLRSDMTEFQWKLGRPPERVSS